MAGGVAAKGLAERDRYPMPESVANPEAFYEVMARAAFDAIGLPGTHRRHGTSRAGTQCHQRGTNAGRCQGRERPPLASEDSVIARQQPNDLAILRTLNGADGRDPN